MITKLLNIIKSKYLPWIILAVVAIAAFVLWPRRARPNDEYRHDQAQLKTIERLIQVTVDLQKANIAAKDQTISVLQEANKHLTEERKTADAYYTQIKTSGNEKINRVDSYTVPDIERYMSERFGH